MCLESSVKTTKSETKVFQKQEILFQSWSWTC